MNVMEEIITSIERRIVFEDLPQKVGLMDGYAGYCLFYHQLYLATGLSEYKKKYEKYVSAVCAYMEKSTISFDIKSGLSGIVWLFDYLQKYEPTFKVDPTFQEQCNGLLKNSFSLQLKHNNWEYLRGAIGCLYSIGDRDSYSELVDYVKLRMDENDDKLGSIYYHENTNLGLPFGILGLLHVLYKGMHTNYDANILLKRILNIVISNEIILDDAIVFPAFAKDDDKCRLSWAYGELIYSFQLLLVAEAMGDNELKTKAIKIAKLSTCRSSLDSTYINDVCIQHGCAGIYLLYSLFYIKTKEPLFYTAKENWKDLLMHMLLKREYRVLDRHSRKLQYDCSLLEGLAGVGLVLLDSKYDWYGCLMLS